jgi:predicted MPP superfamily phosphohydrolase
MSARRAWTWVAALLILAALASALAGYRNATADPLVRRLTVRLAGFPEDSPPVRIVLFSDLHVHGPDMPPRRVARIMDEIDALHPDLILAAGDFVGNALVGRKYPVEQALAPLARLKAQYGVYAVLGNNDQIGFHLCSAARPARNRSPKTDVSSDSRFPASIQSKAFQQI